MNPDFNKLDIPLSFRIPHELHTKYKSLSGHSKKVVQFMFVEWLKKRLRELK